MTKQEIIKEYESILDRIYTLVCIAQENDYKVFAETDKYGKRKIGILFSKK